MCLLYDNNKLSQCRDSERPRSLHCLKLFKVIDVGTIRKLVCDFQLENNTNLHLILHRYFKLSYSVSIKLMSLTKVPLVNALVNVQLTPLNYAHKICQFSPWECT